MLTSATPHLVLGVIILVTPQRRTASTREQRRALHEFLALLLGYDGNEMAFVAMS